MKKIYPGFSTLICLSFLFALDSCTTDPAFVSDDTLGIVDVNKENPYYNSRKGDIEPVHSEDSFTSTERISNTLLEAYPAQDSISTYSTTDAATIIDPDWKKLITRFMEGKRGAK